MIGGTAVIDVGCRFSQDKIAELQVKRLEMVQAIISRLANNGATLKNYCITLTTAICGFAVTLQRPLIAFLALLPIVVFARWTPNSYASSDDLERYSINSPKKSGERYLSLQSISGLHHVSGIGRSCVAGRY